MAMQPMNRSEEEMQENEPAGMEGPASEEMREGEMEGGAEGEMPAGIDGNQVKDLLGIAIDMLYGESFEALVDYMQKSGAKGFPDASVQTVLEVLKKIDEMQGGIDPKTKLAVGMALLAMLASDMAEGGVIEGLDQDMVKVSIQNFMAKFMEANPDSGMFEDAVTEMKNARQQSVEQNGPALNPGQKTSGFLGGV
jgi:hypothetical protein